MVGKIKITGSVVGRITDNICDEIQIDRSSVSKKNGNIEKKESNKNKNRFRLDD